LLLVSLLLEEPPEVTDEPPPAAPTVVSAASVAISWADMAVDAAVEAEAVTGESSGVPCGFGEESTSPSA